MTCDVCAFELDVVGLFSLCGVALENDAKNTDRNNNAEEKTDVKREAKAGSAYPQYL
jgi:hypothetical protein